MSTATPPRLRKSVIPASFELPSSFLSRVAWANGFLTSDEFCSITGLNRLHIPPVHDHYAQTLGEWTGVPKAAIQQFSIAGGKIVPFGHGSIKRTQLHKVGVRYCPHCLQNDKTASNGPTSGYIRAQWQWRMISHCPDHGCLLAQDGAGLQYLESFSSLAQEVSRSELGEPSPCDRYFFDRLSAPAGTTFLDELPAYVAAEFCTLIGHFQKALEDNSLNERIEGGVENWELRRKGFDIAVHGRDAIWDFLTDYVAKTSKRIRLPRRIYSPFLRWWTSNKHNHDYKLAFDFFQEHAEEHVALKPGDAFVTMIYKRKVFTLSSAAKHYGLSEERALRVLQAKMGTKIVPHFLCRNEIHFWLLEAASYVTTRDVSIALHCSMKVCDDFIKAGLIAVAPNRDYEGRVYRLVHKLEIESFAEKLTGIVNVDLETAGLVSAGQIFRTCRCRIVDILSMAFAGKLSRIGHAGSKIGIAGLFFDPSEVRAEMAAQQQRNRSSTKGFDHDLIDLRAARLRLGIKKLAMDELVDQGIIPSEEIESGNGWEGSSRKLVRVVDLDAFGEQHISIDDIVEKRRLDRPVLLNWLKEEGVQPVFEGSNRTSKIFKKSDIASLGLL